MDALRSFMYTAFVQSGEIIQAKVFAPSRGLSAFPDQLGRIQNALYHAPPEFSGSLRLQIVDETILDALDRQFLSMPKYFFSDEASAPEDDEYIQMPGRRSRKTIEESLADSQTLNPQYMIGQSLARIRQTDRELLRNDDPRINWTADDLIMRGKMVALIHFVAQERDYERNFYTWKTLGLLTELSTGNHGHLFINPEVFSGLTYETGCRLAVPVANALMRAILDPIPNSDPQADIRAGGFDFCDINAHRFGQRVRNSIRPVA
jgi:hypothetical protein